MRRHDGDGAKAAAPVARSVTSARGRDAPGAESVVPGCSVPRPGVGRGGRSEERGVVDWRMLARADAVGFSARLSASIYTYTTHAMCHAVLCYAM